MSWAIQDEWFDLAKSRHVVLVKNRDTGEELHLIHSFPPKVCETCGAIGPATPIDFEKYKTQKLVELNAHHRQSLAYAEQHPHVRKDTGPKK
jgi:hypothetical protein